MPGAVEHDHNQVAHMLPQNASNEAQDVGQGHIQETVVTFLMQRLGHQRPKSDLLAVVAGQVAHHVG